MFPHPSSTLYAFEGRLISKGRSTSFRKIKRARPFRQSPQKVCARTLPECNYTVHKWHIYMLNERQNSSILRSYILKLAKDLRVEPLVYIFSASQREPNFTLGPYAKNSNSQQHLEIEQWLLCMWLRVCTILKSYTQIAYFGHFRFPDRVER